MFEWACFLAAKQPRYLHVACEFMLTHDSAPMYVRAIRDLSVEHAHCTVAADRLILVAMINSSFRSVAAFELFAKVTAVALLARTTAKQAGRSGVDEFAQTWVELAVELKQPRLAAALRAAECARWRAQSLVHASSWLPESTFRKTPTTAAAAAVPNALCLPGGGSTDSVGEGGCPGPSDARPRVVELWQRRSWRDAYLICVDRWFTGEIEPLLLEIKKRCVLPAERRPLAALELPDGAHSPTPAHFAEHSAQTLSPSPRRKSYASRFRRATPLTLALAGVDVS